MQMNHAAFSQSPSLRLSLKKGLARQVIDAADRISPDLPALFRLALELRPNAKGLERLALRIKGRPGVSRVAIDPQGKALTFIARAVRNVSARIEGEQIFRETGLIYLRARVSVVGSGISFHLSAVSFCQHALERAIERSPLPIDRPLLPKIDTEARAIFRGWDRAARILDGDDEFYPADLSGLWVGGHDELALEPEWNLFNSSGLVPIFSVRTFYSENEMRPTVWLRWKDDPTCRIE